MTETRESENAVNVSKITFTAFSCNLEVGPFLSYLYSTPKDHTSRHIIDLRYVVSVVTIRGRNLTRTELSFRDLSLSD